MKSRGVYETPGGTILLAAHRAIESITLDRGAAHLKDELMPRYAELIYNGFWFSPEREMLQALIDKSQEHVEGEVRLKLYKGNVIVTGRRSPKSLYSDDARHLRGRPRRLRPEGRRGLHPPQRAAAAHAGGAQAPGLNFLHQAKKARRCAGPFSFSGSGPSAVDGVGHAGDGLLVDAGRVPAGDRAHIAAGRRRGRQPWPRRKLAVDASAVALSRRFMLPTPYFRTLPGRNCVWPISPCVAPTELGAERAAVDQLQRGDGVRGEEGRDGGSHRRAS